MLKLTTPKGRIEIDPNAIIAISEESDMAPTRVRVWVKEDAFNITEDFETVIRKFYEAFPNDFG